ncbi:hypothetical protein P152DRAFT_461516 [Eremomyces bilateralis CBS 781.70]|uniref:peptidylprolyl isomerase n=1 Tax=Eremomyces bilateralis CBS 781.70 TaxID=1392243 RepID=A0A6G1FU94_9PEZI|nr:uncharacterized protein P152DRAFT_461516 [Eremomyces bilateralis CBS 781.70]KAF1809333.1 hypothetical protein P152DRAFT_461516 [Eremomyces bilateralis CBS 781.70]
MRLFPSYSLLAILSAPLLHAEKLASGLEIDVTDRITCSRPTVLGDQIEVHYRGTIWGTKVQFDSSYERGTPFGFRLGQGQVIQGWDEGLVGMCIGEGRRLTIPPSMAYGDRAVGAIPGGSTLVFDTVLVSIDGVEPPQSESPSPTPTSTDPATSISPDTASTTTGIAIPSSDASLPGSHGPGRPGDHECDLLGDFSLLVQSSLGLLALTSLVYKRWRETPRRPLKIWAFDASKQVVGSMMLHVLNVLMSMLSSGKFDIKDAATAAATPGPDITPRLMRRDDGFAQYDGSGDAPNPCSYYLLNLGIDTTIGIPILLLWLKVFHYAFSLTPLARPLISIESGVYSPLPNRSNPNPQPRTTWWLKQCLIYFLGLLGMKLCVLGIFLLCPWIAWVGDWALRWTEGSAALQITFVMLIFPTVMNVMQYWIIDSFIKERKDPGARSSAEAERAEAARAEQAHDRDEMGIQMTEEDEDDANENERLLKGADPTHISGRPSAGSSVGGGSK